MNLRAHQLSEWKVYLCLGHGGGHLEGIIVKMGSIGQSNHLEFRKVRLEKGRKLHKYEVVNHNLFGNIGIIHWRGGWRQYVFQAHP